VPRFLLVIFCLAPLTACSGAASRAPNSPTPAVDPAPPSPSGPPSITVTASGLSPREVTIVVGGTVRLVNGDSRTHDLMGGLDPSRPECPEIANAGFLAPGQSREAGPFATAQVCNFHSHAFTGVAAFQGKITVQ
jgi:hypothetical protein